MYDPAVATVIEGVVSAVDHTKFVPVVVNVDVPQLSTTVTTGATGAKGSDNDSTIAFDGHPLLNRMLYVPAANPVIVNGNVTIPVFPVPVPVHETTPVPVPVTTIEPSVPPHVDGFKIVPEAIVIANPGLATPEPGKLVHPPTVCVTVYIPAVGTVIVAVVSVVDHNKFVPVVDRTDPPQPSTTVTTGANGIANGFAIPVPDKLVQPPTVCVTV